MQCPPPVPPRASRPVQSTRQVMPIATDPNPAGALYPPGQWPTPELSLSPVGRYSILTAPSAYTSDAIQSTLDSLGTSSTLYLPQASVWTITQAIRLLEHQELATWGYPTDENDMARLEATKECRPHIVYAPSISGAALRNVVVDGGRERYGYDHDCGVMLQFGNKATDQVIDRCIIRHPRQWSCIQAFQGSQNVRITNNIIGPAGIGADKENGKWADGISFAGANGLVAGNKIQDATDGAIVVFGAPGTLIISNTIICRERLCLGGINMVDWGPHDGNYAHTRVMHNTIMTQGPAGYIKVGIGQGPSVWWTSPSDHKFNRGAIVTKNLIDSQDVGLGHGAVGYGFAVAADVRNWICVGNKSASTVQYQGDITRSLPVPNVSPGPFVYDVPQIRLWFTPSTLESGGTHHADWVALQPEFSSGRGRIRHLISISPGFSRVLAYAPGQFRLEKGSTVALQQATLGYEEDGIIRVRDRLGSGIGTVLWEAGPHTQVSSSDSFLTYTTGGKLCLINNSDSQICFDLTPHMPLHAAPRNDENSTLSFVFADSNPHLSVTSQGSSILFSSSYCFPPNRAFPGGQVVSRTYLFGNTPCTILYTLSPYCQFVILRSKDVSAIVPALPLVWPAAAQEPQWDWEIVWTTPNPRTKERRNDAIMYFQGDGNLVIRSQGTVPWASGSCGKSPPAAYLRLGVGSIAEPWVEVVDADGGRVWSS